MLIYPAIDLRGGRVVRLTQGDYRQETVYADDPTAIAAAFEQAGATCLHVVDLDGAKDGAPHNRAVIRELAKTSLFVEVGGGMRTEADVAETLSLGVDRVILGTLAIQDFELTKRLGKQYGEKLAVGVDARDGRVATHGWQTVTDVDSLDFCRRLLEAGIDTVIYTDISRDGLLSGANLTAYERLRSIDGLRVIASGGVTEEKEIEALRDLGIYGAIVGKALYTGRLTLPRVLAIARGEVCAC